MTKRKGFTLVELVVVMVIIAILAAAAVLGFSTFTKSARLTRAQEEHSALRTAANMWVSNNIGSDGAIKDPTQATLANIAKYMENGDESKLLKVGGTVVHKIENLKLTTDLGAIDPDLKGKGLAGGEFLEYTFAVDAQ